MVNGDLLNMKIKIKIYYADTDCAGVVYYARYLEYFERARMEFFEKKGLSIKEVEKSGISFIVKSVSVEYISPARCGDTIKVDIRLSKISGASLLFNYVIKTAGTRQVLLVNGTTKMVAVDKYMKPARIPDYVKERLKVD